MSDERDQPPLPFDPALQLRPQPPAEPQQELSLETFATRLFEEVARRSAAIAEREQRSA